MHSLVTLSLSVEVVQLIPVTEVPVPPTPVLTVTRLALPHEVSVPPDTKISVGFVAAPAGVAMVTPAANIAEAAIVAVQTRDFLNVSPRCSFAIGGPGHEWVPLKGI